MDNPLLKLDGVIAGYGSMTILNGTSFEVRRGVITTVIGPNGAGKSTVFKAIFGLLKLRAGSIHFDGQSITGWSPRHLIEAGIVYVPQGRNIFPEMSVRHNLEFGAVAAANITDLPQRIEAALDRFPALREKADVQASTLSGGQQKQLEIMRGLLLDPKLILIDEPSIGLSPLLVQETFAILQELRAKGVTILMIEQNARMALEMSDDGLVLELGQTRLHGPAHDILNDPRIAQLFLGGAMGAALMTGLGLALAQPKRKVLVVTGDGDLLMSVGGLATIALQNPKNMTVICVDNGHYGETGNQESHTGLGIRLDTIAAGSGFAVVHTINTEEDLEEGRRLLREGTGLSFILLRVKEGPPNRKKRNLVPHMERENFRKALLG